MYPFSLLDTVKCTAGLAEVKSFMLSLQLLSVQNFSNALSLSPSQDRSCEIVEDMEANKVRKMKRRICLVLDCLCAHDFSDKTADLINLQHYVIKEKRLSEREAIVIFYDVVRVVEALHKVSCHGEMVLKPIRNQN